MDRDMHNNYDNQGFGIEVKGLQAMKRAYTQLSSYRKFVCLENMK